MYKECFGPKFKRVRRIEVRRSLKYAFAEQACFLTKRKVYLQTCVISNNIQFNCILLQSYQLVFYFSPEFPDKNTEHKLSSIFLYSYKILPIISQPESIIHKNIMWVEQWLQQKRCGDFSIASTVT